MLEETTLYGEQHGFLPLLAANGGFKVVEIDLPQARPRRCAQGSAAARLRASARRHPVRVLPDALHAAAAALLRPRRRGVHGRGPPRARGRRRAAPGFRLCRSLSGPALILSSLLVAVGLQVLAIGLIGELIVFINARSMRQYRVREIIEAGAETPRKKSALSDAGRRRRVT